MSEYQLPADWTLLEDEEGAPFPHRVQRIMAQSEDGVEHVGLDAAIEYVMLSLEAASSREIAGLTTALIGLVELADKEDEEKRS